MRAEVAENRNIVAMHLMVLDHIPMVTSRSHSHSVEALGRYMFNGSLGLVDPKNTVCMVSNTTGILKGHMKAVNVTHNNIYGTPQQHCYFQRIR